ncbi:NAD(P)H-dependent oxidoreductase [Rhizobium sp. EC-SD404]|uniref:FMN-dependent NADH-azoreductase n=1 Tax=Rhizobium sp. EC-SD404 TaxID=2038389 RepID=UPI001256A239|nr:NAD(P)H-dependent oxidoreductase [Rhizobium sp. EC-SD404]VVT14939.1 FMN-dependent NADH-azoreductase [Rhizobium sp. EC-SD404]
MTRLLVIETSPRGDDSVSRQMMRRFVRQWQDSHPGAAVTIRDLTETTLPFVTGPWLQAYFTPPEHQSEAMRNELRLSDELVDELLSADHIAIATPVYNYNVPAALKAWIDHIVRKGKTLGFDGAGLVTNRRATVLLASGGVYTPDSPMRHMDIAQQYLRLVLGVIGITDVTVVSGGGAKAVDMRQDTMDGFLNRLEPHIALAAAS